MKKTIIFLLVVISFALLSGFFRNEIRKIKIEKESNSKEIIDAKKREDLLSEKVLILEQEILVEKDQREIYTFLAVGDIMLDRGVEKALRREDDGDYNFPFEKITKHLNSADYVFGNLEGSLSDQGSDQGGKYSFRFDPLAAEALKNAGFNILSLANNHILDWGRKSVCATTKNLTRENISFVGAGCDKSEAEQEKIVELGNTKIALVAYSEFHPGWSWAGDDYSGMSAWEPKKIRAKISELKNNPDIDLVFVSVHWGTEYLDRAPDKIVKLGQGFVDAGADVIIGHHPHVDQEIERYGKGWILYSLGNFVFDQSWSENTMEGLLAEIRIQNRNVLDIIPKKIQLNKNYQPYLK